MMPIEMDIVDTHAHLCDKAFDEDLGAVLARAAGAGVRAVAAVFENTRRLYDP